MTWPTVKLGDVCEISRGGSPRPIQNYITEDADGLNWIKIGDVNEGEKYITKTAEKIIPSGLSHTKQIKAGDFLLSNSMSFGRPYISKIDGCIHDGWLMLRDVKNNFSQDYLYHMLTSVAVKDQFIKYATGAVVKNLNKEVVSKVMVPLPPLAEQQRIAAILDKVEEVKRKREQVIAKLDELAQSRFVELFGDLALNELNWETKTLKEISVTKGQYGGGFSAAEFQANSPRYVRITDITDEGELKPDAVSAEGDEKDFENYYLSDGDLLLARSGATVGKAYLHKSKLPHIYAGYLIRFVIDVKQALPEYVYAVTRTQYYKNWVLSKQNVVAQPNINAQQYGDLKIPVPPLSLQIEYAHFMDVLLKQKRMYYMTTEKLSSLVASLQHQAFTTGFNV